MAKTARPTPEAADSKSATLTLGVKLRHARLVAGYTLLQLASKAGCSESLISKIERGLATPSFTTLHRLAVALDTNIGALTSEEDAGQSPILRHGERPVIRVGGVALERVVLAKRGGLLRHGSVLTVTSYATRTSPVIRGKWILENILGVPPPPPPPAVPALAEKVNISKPMSMRERLAEHRDNPACRGCHQLMDPIGFALENYDAVGRYRQTENARPLDLSGGLPDGSKFTGVDGLQQALLRRPEIFAGTFTEKLMTYALGRGVETTDAPAVRKIVRETKGTDFKFSSFILGIVNSTPFQMRRSS